MLNEEITPSLEKLQKEQKDYRRFQSNASKLERLKRISVANTYVKKKNLLNGDSDAFMKIQEEHEGLETKKADLTKTIEENDAVIDEMLKQKELETNGALSDLKDTEDKLSKELVQSNSTYTNKLDMVKSEKAKLKTLTKQLKDVERAKSKMEATKLKKAKDVDAVLAKKEKAVAELEKNQQQYQGLSAGITSGDGNEQKSLAEDLLKAEAAKVSAATTVKQNQMKIKHSQKSLRSTTQKVKKAAPAHKKVSQQLQVFEKAQMEAQQKLAKLNYTPEAKVEKQRQADMLQREIQTLRDRKQRLSARVAQYDFKYTNPSRNFDPRKVKGTVASLVSVKDNKHMRALEIVAGGKLRQVVVDDAQTSKDLIKHGKLKRRVTIIPQDKIRDKTLPADKLQRATAAGGGRDHVNLALGLIDYAPAVSAAMKYVFGDTVVCSSSDAANRSTSGAKVRSVTLQGDEFSPSGTLSGGSAPKGPGILSMLQQLHNITAELEDKQQQLVQVQQELQRLCKLEKQFSSLQSVYERARRQLEVVKERDAQSKFSLLLEKEQQIKEEINAQKQELAEAEAQVEELDSTCKSLQKQIAAFGASLEELMAAKEKEIAAGKKAVKKIDSKCVAKQQELDDCDLEITQYESECKGINEQLAEATKITAGLEKEVDELKQIVAAKKESYGKARAALQKKQEELLECDGQVKQLNKKRQRLKRQSTSLQAQIKKVEHKKRRFEEEKKTAEKVVEKLEKDFPWIQQEQEFFGQPNTDYDFNNCDMKTINKQINKLEKEQEDLQRKVNHKVTGMIEKAERDYKELKKKREIVTRDKAKLLHTIKELDERKQKALQVAYTKINADFGSMFETLLPGCTAKLAPVEGSNIHLGLRPMVAFSGKWKDGLMELSGGQRSLLALSLILAMLLFKPAPMYILDEVDAALDLSHTQNIGQLLKSHFSQSQFIVVSLKEGMFDNANVIFTTSNVDGVSGVSRTETLHGRQQRQMASRGQSKPKASRNRSRRSKKARIDNRDENEGSVVMNAS